MASQRVSVHKWGLIVCLIALIFSTAISVNATTLTFTGTTGNITLNVTDTDSGYTAVDAVIDPYKGLLGSNPVLIWCVDPDHEVNTNDSWSVYVNNAGSINQSQTYLGAGSLTTYEEIAWLINQFQGTTNTTTKQEIQAAIWLIDEGETTLAAGQSTSGFT